MIYKPYSLLPSDLEDGNNVIDITNDVTFTFMVTGTTPIGRMGIQIGDLNNTNPTSLTYPYYIGVTASPVSAGSTINPIQINNVMVTAYTGAVCARSSDAFIFDGSAWRAYGAKEDAVKLFTPPIYYTNLDGSAKLMSMTFSSAALRSAVGTTSDQKWRVWIRDINNQSTLADWVFVKLRTTPSALISTDTLISTKSNTWTLTYTPSVPYENGVPGTTATSVRSVRWRVFDTLQPTSALYDTGEIYGCIQPTYSVDGLMSGHKYYAEATIVDQDGVVTVAVSQDVNVEYAPGPDGIMQLVYTDEIDGIHGDVSHGREIALCIENVLGENGQSTMGRDGYTTVDIGDNTGYVLENFTGNTISWSDIEYLSRIQITARMRFTPLPYINGGDIAAIYIRDPAQPSETYSHRIRYAIGTGTGGNALFPSETLYPSDSLYPNAGAYSITAYLESLIDDMWTLRSTYQLDIDITSMSNDTLVYFEHKFSPSDFELDYFSKKRVELYGRTGSRFAYFVIDRYSASYYGNTSRQISPPFSTAQFAVFFNNFLHAVNKKTMISPTRITLYRSQSNKNMYHKIAQISLGEAELPTHLIDLTAANDESYQYVMYPEDASKVSVGTYGYRPADNTDIISGYVACEMLVTAHWDDNYGAYVAERVFYFDFNNKPQQINNNAVVQKNQTFSRFFNIQHGATNTLSGQINGLIGYIDCSIHEFVSSFEIEDAIRWLTTDSSIKLYKSARGYVLPVDITSAITFTPSNSRMVSDVSFEWTEIKLPHPTTVIGVISE